MGVIAGLGRADDASPRAVQRNKAAAACSLLGPVLTLQHRCSTGGSEELGAWTGLELGEHRLPLRHGHADGNFQLLCMPLACAVTLNFFFNLLCCRLASPPRNRSRKLRSALVSEGDRAQHVVPEGWRRVSVSHSPVWWSCHCDPQREMPGQSLVREAGHCGSPP